MQNRSWFLLSKKLSGIATDEELAELEEYLAAHPEWRYAVDHLGGIWATNPDGRSGEEDFLKHIQRMQKLGHDTAVFRVRDETGLPQTRKVPGIWARIALIAASVVIAFACWFIFRQKTQLVASNNLVSATNKKVLQTNSGDRRKMLLPDGTQVWLNAESKLEYNQDYGKSNRDVTLSGEAFFDVVKNVEMPFTIQTNKIHIKVTGTAFNVKAYPGDKTSETSLIRGRVEVTVNARPDEKFVLKPNDKLVVRDESAIQQATGVVAREKQDSKPVIQIGYINFLKNDTSVIETAWVYDRLVLYDESLEDISKKMERWYGVHININDQQIARQHLSYTIKNETVDQALNYMRYALRFNYSINGNNITITR